MKLTEITSLFQRFTDAHEEYNADLIDETQRQESLDYFVDIESSLNFFFQMVNHWLRVMETSVDSRLLIRLLYIMLAFFRAF